jgi:hypothetical protein
MKRIRRDTGQSLPAIRKAFLYLSDNSIPLATRIDETVLVGGKYHVPGIGLNIATKVLAMLNPKTMGVFNKAVRDTLRSFGYKIDGHGSRHRGRQVQRRGESPTWNGVEGGCKPVCTSAARKTGDTPCARQEQRSSGGLVSLLGAERMNRFQGRRCGLYRGCYETLCSDPAHRRCNCRVAQKLGLPELGRSPVTNSVEFSEGITSFDLVRWIACPLIRQVSRRKSRSS